MNKIKKGLGRGLSSLIGETKIEKNTTKLSIGDLNPNKFQPRKIFDEDSLNDLEKSIKETRWDDLKLTNSDIKKPSTNIINYLRRPNVKLLTGKDGFIVPIISEGKITDVDIINSGSEYTTPPELEVVGVGGTTGTVGQFAKLESVVSDGKITSVNIISGGTGYDLSLIHI